MVEFLRRTLKNGIRVIMEKRELPVVALSISNPFGAGVEDEDVKGVAHVIEHMLFTGTKTRTHEDISREIEKKGGILNAFTSNEITSFWFKLPSEHVFSGLEILTDMLNNPKFDPQKFEKEKKVVIEEIKMRRDDPSSDVFNQIVNVLFEKPFGVGIIGTKDSVSNLKRDFVYEYYKDNYNPANFIVTLVGNADFDKICNFLEKNFKNNNKIIKKTKVKNKNGEIIETRAGVDQANFVIAMHAPLIGDKDFTTLEVLNAYLAQGMSSKLFLKIREEKGLVYNVRGSIEAEKNYSYYIIYAGTRKEAIPEVKKIIFEEFDKIENMNEKELKEAKEQLIGLRKVTSEESASVMNELVFAELAGKAEDYYNHEKKITSVKLEDVKRLAKSLIKKYSTAAIVPK